MTRSGVSYGQEAPSQSGCLAALFAQVALAPVLKPVDLKLSSISLEPVSGVPVLFDLSLEL